MFFFMQVYDGLARILCRCEAQLAAIGTLLRCQHMDDANFLSLWRAEFTGIGIDSIPPPSGGECYKVTGGIVELRIPFVQRWLEDMKGMCCSLERCYAAYNSGSQRSLRRLQRDLENAMGNCH